MNIKRLEDFITQMPREINTRLKKARYLYIELGKRSFYDRSYEYMLFGEENDYAIYSNKLYSEPNIIICTTLIKQYSELLTSANIKNRILVDKLGHYYLIFEDDNNTEHSTDITNDLKNIQFRCSTSYFGIGTISKRDLRIIDLDIGYISEKKGYSNDYWYMIKDRLQRMKLSEREKCEKILESLKLFGDLSKLGEAELFEMYKKFFQYCSDGNESLQFYSSKMTNKPEEYFAKLVTGNTAIIYRLNRETLEFDLLEERNQGTVEK